MANKNLENSDDSVKPIQDFLLNKVFGFMPKDLGMILTGTVLIMYGVACIAVTFFPQFPSIGLSPPEAIAFIGYGLGLIFTKRSHINNKKAILKEIREIKTNNVNKSDNTALVNQDSEE